MEQVLLFTLGVVTIPLIAGVVSMFRTKKEIETISEQVKAMSGNCSRDNRDIYLEIGNVREELIKLQEKNYNETLNLIEELKEATSNPEEAESLRKLIVEINKNK